MKLSELDKTTDLRRVSTLGYVVDEQGRRESCQVPLAFLQEAVDKAVQAELTARNAVAEAQKAVAEAQKAAASAERSRRIVEDMTAIIGGGKLPTEADTIIGAINELYGYIFPTAKGSFSKAFNRSFNI